MSMNSFFCPIILKTEILLVTCLNALCIETEMFVKFRYILFNIVEYSLPNLETEIFLNMESFN